MPKGISFFYVGQRWLTLSGQLLRLILPGRQSQIFPIIIISYVLSNVKHIFNRTYVLSNFYFCQIFVVFFCACPGRQIFPFVKFSNELQTSCEKAAPRSCKRAANFFFFQTPRSCKFYKLSNFKEAANFEAAAQSHQKIKFEKATNFLYNIYRR